MRTAYFFAGLAAGLIPANLLLHRNSFVVYDIICVPLMLVCAKILKPKAEIKQS